jgi:hypothetical protein
MKVHIGPYPKNGENRKIDIRIDRYDVWSMDATLAMIIHPMLVMLKEVNHGTGLIDDEDVPEELRSTSVPLKENEFDTDDNFFARWDYVMDEMIWAFGNIKDSLTDGPSYLDLEAYKIFNERIHNGTRLFGKYYQTLWD